MRGQSGHLTLAPGPSHLHIFEGLCRDADATGDLAPNAQLAAIAIEHGAEVVSFDRDFARFAGVRWVAAVRGPSRLAGHALPSVPASPA